uniref:Uncharacterized protein n=1 Tax=Anopheles minimus TaxID=112268 RepID=A0A182WN43_9DIPT
MSMERRRRIFLMQLLYGAAAFVGTAVIQKFHQNQAIQSLNHTQSKQLSSFDTSPSGTGTNTLTATMMASKYTYVGSFRRLIFADNTLLMKADDDTGVCCLSECRFAR